MTGQLLRFSLVGIAAMLVHWFTVVTLVPFGLAPLLANVVAFIVAFQVSYMGHRQWTFADQPSPHSRSLPRFFAVAVSSFLVNEGLYFLLLSYTALDYRLALLLVLASVALLTFMLSKQWAFRTL